MKILRVAALTLAAGWTLGRSSAQGVAPSCVMCEADYISAQEIAEYVDIARATNLTDQQVRSIDVGKTNVQVALAHRGALDAPRPQSVAEHDLVTEVYVVLSGSATNRTGPDLVDKVRGPDDYRSVVYLNGPGHNGVSHHNRSREIGGKRLVHPCLSSTTTTLPTSIWWTHG